MKTIIQLSILGALMLSLVSCEKVIDINLKSTEKKYVVEANLSNVTGNCRVLLSQTKDFNDNNSFEGIAGALVTITESGGVVTPLTPVADGVYEAPAFTGTSGKTYNLSVQVNGQTFTATSTMPAPVDLDTIFTTRETLFDDPKLIVNVEFSDPPGKGNNYRFIQYFNSVRQEQLQFMNDDYTDGRYVNSKLFYFGDDDEKDKDLKSGDEVIVEMYCIDPAMYKYWFSLFRSSTGDSNQATPSNPVSNMRGGALGYFSAHTVQTKKMFIP
ncbi:MAG: DUF4249 domain-containing protein [Chitinophagaceae bacterium]|nr:MAG: DUF4249 domain-containing protein [Chitinophagaceae bacterium]